MQHERMDRTRFYRLALFVSGTLALLLTVLTDWLFPVPSGKSTLFGLLAFFFIVVFDLFVMYLVWVTRQAEGRGAARMLAGLAARGLALALAVGLILRFVSQFSLEALIASSFLVSYIESLTFRWISRRNPDPAMPKWTRWFVFSDVFFFFLGAYLVIDVWRESPRAAAVGMVGALPLMLLLSHGDYLRWKDRQAGQTADSIAPAVES